MKVSGPGKKINQLFRNKFWRLMQKRLDAPTSVCEIGPGAGELGLIINRFGHRYSCCEEADANTRS